MKQGCPEDAPRGALHPPQQPGAAAGELQPVLYLQGSWSWRASSTGSMAGSAGSLAAGLQLEVGRMRTGLIFIAAHRKQINAAAHPGYAQEPGCESGLNY